MGSIENKAFSSSMIIIDFTPLLDANFLSATFTLNCEEVKVLVLCVICEFSPSRTIESFSMSFTPIFR